MKRFADVYDLDGTIFTQNSFHVFLIFAIKHLILQIRLFIVFKILMFIGLRGIRLISHFTLKKNILKLTSCLDDALLDAFAMSIFRKSSRNFNYLRSFVRSGNLVVLATAAPDIYAVRVARLLNFDYVISSYNTNEVYVEALGTTKRDLLIKLAGRECLNYINFFSDHFDDISFANCVMSFYLVNPTKKNYDKFLKSGVYFNLLRFD